MDKEISKYLSKYFSLHGMITIPGLGELSVIRIPSTNDFANKLFYPPLYRYRFENNLHSPEVSLLEYLKRKLSLDDDQLQVLLTNFGEDINAQLNENGKLDWEGIGRFTLDEKNVVHFFPVNNQSTFSDQIKYEHVTRDQYVTDVLIGDYSQSSEDLNNYLEEQNNARLKQMWKTASIILVSISIALLIYRFMLGNFDLFDPRHDPINPKDSPPSYSILNK